MLFNSNYLDLCGYVIGLCVFIPVWVLIMLYWQLKINVSGCLSPSEDNVVEFVWTLLPSFFVLYLCYLNLHCLYSDVFRSAESVVKVIGRQWYWDYEYVGELDSCLFHSYMGDFINSVDKPLRLNYDTSYCLLITSGDVIHSFSVPSLKLKMDAVPGRINQVYLTPWQLGVFVGYCSELCGAGHAYMPIVIEVVREYHVVKVSGSFNISKWVLSFFV